MNTLLSTKPTDAIEATDPAAADGNPPAGLRGIWNQLASQFTRLVPHDALALIDRLAIAAIFFLSGRTKVEGWLTVTDSAYALFRDEYKLPLIPVEIAAHAAAWAEHLFPLLLMIGLFTRLSALALLGMTLVIQLFVYPDAWPTHLSWAGLLLYLVGRGGGTLSLDRLLRIR
ncbi:DoxX family protein [Polaromonas sp.]|uniref:DoxX family protein n=1 Tax=Polaromonas sp. TaxID=1869339 RepID=UPI00286B0EB2|nr:DoxX family protein [Polaromonas sp.]